MRLCRHTRGADALGSFSFLSKLTKLSTNRKYTRKKMSLRADILKTNPNKLKSVMKEVSAILGRIDDEIKAAYDRDENKVSVSVPITFAIPYMSNKNAQRAVYYKLLESLMDRGFIVKIFLSNDQTVFYITWLSEDEQKDIDAQNTLLAKFSTIVSQNQTQKKEKP